MLVLMSALDTPFHWFWGVAFIVVFFGTLFRSSYMQFRVRADTPFEIVDPADPMCPNEVRAFWRDIGTQVESLGFAPAAYLQWFESQPGTVEYWAVYQHAEHRDTAIAKAIVNFNALVGKLALIAEFNATSVEGVVVTTRTYADSRAHWNTKRNLGMSIPDIGDMKALYEMHTAHLASRGITARQALPAPEVVASELVAVNVRLYQDYHSAGYVRRVSDENVYGLRLIPAIAVVGISMLNICRLRRALARRRARRWLTGLGLSSDYPKADFLPRVIEASRERFDLPRPAWYSESKPNG